MPSNIICVYQDCVLCGDRGKRLKAKLDVEGINIRKVSFASPEGQELCRRAIFEHHIPTMPFFTNGIKFSTKIEDFVEKPVENSKKPRKKVKKARKEVKKETEVESGTIY